MPIGLTVHAAVIAKQQFGCFVLYLTSLIAIAYRVGFVGVAQLFILIATSHFTNTLGSLAPIN